MGEPKFQQGDGERRWIPLSIPSFNLSPFSTPALDPGGNGRRKKNLRKDF
jgi:hypothetical protein